MAVKQLKIDDPNIKTGNPYRVKAIMTLNAACNELISEQSATLKNLWIVMATNLHKWSKNSKDTEKYYDEFRQFQIVIGQKIGNTIPECPDRDIIWEKINNTCRSLRYEHGVSWQDLWFSFSLNIRCIAEDAHLPQQDLDELEQWHFIIGSKLSNERDCLPKKAA